MNPAEYQTCCIQGRAKNSKHEYIENLFQLAIAGEQSQNLTGINNKIYSWSHIFRSAESDSDAMGLQISWSGLFWGPG